MGGFGQSLRLWTPWLLVGCLAAVGLLAGRADGQAAFERMNGAYELNATYDVAAFSADCAAELAIDTTIDSETNVLEAAQLSVAGTQCTGGNISLTAVPSARYTFKVDDIDGLTEFRVRLDDGFYGAIPEGGAAIECGSRTFTSGAAFLYMEAGKLTWNDAVDAADNVVRIDEPTVFLLESLPADKEFTVCAYTAMPTACFPAGATVQLESGDAVRMDSLTVGHRVLVGNGRYSEVYTFGHRRRDTAGRFVQLDTAAGQRIRLSPKHLLAVAGKYVPADVVRVGDSLTTGHGELDNVVSVSTLTDHGFFAPHTLDGSIVVDGVLASTYTAHLEPEFAHKLLAPIRLIYRVTSVDILAGILDSGVPSVLRQLWTFGLGLVKMTS